MALAAYAKELGENIDLWAATGLLHDFDYELHPDKHPSPGMAHLAAEEWPEELIQAIGSHCDHLGIARDTPLRRYLFACDEISGFLTAVAYVRPSKKIAEVEVKSVLKKLKTPAFAAAVSREDVSAGAEAIGKPLEDHIAFVLAALQAEAERLGL